MTVSPGSSNRAPRLGEESSINALPRILNRDSGSLRRTFWLIITVAGWSGCIYHIVDTVQTYFQYGVDVSTSIIYENGIGFPGVTICNLNAIKRSNLRPTLGPRGIIFVQHALEKEHFPLNRQEIELPPLGDRVPLSRALRENYTYLLYSEEVDILRYGHNLTDMVIYGSYQDNEITAYNFTKWPHPVYGNCYTVYVNSEDFPSAAGPEKGLELLLFAEEFENIHSVNPKAGFRVEVHPNITVPLPAEKGFDLTPMADIQVQVDEHIFKRLASPYTSCFENQFPNKSFVRLDVKEDNFLAGIQIYANRSFAYSRTACEINCMMEKDYNVCGCVDAEHVSHKYNRHKWIPGRPGFRAPACDLTSPTVRDCLDKVKAGGLMECQSNCEEECLHMQPHITIASSTYATDTYIKASISNWQALLESYGEPLRVFLCGRFCPKDTQMSLDELLNSVDVVLELVKANVCKLRVYFREMKYMLIEQQAAMAVSDLFVSIGGILGLWIGMCSITMAEFVELFIDLLLCWKEKRN